MPSCISGPQLGDRCTGEMSCDHQDSAGSTIMHGRLGQAGGPCSFNEVDIAFLQLAEGSLNFMNGKKQDSLTKGLFPQFQSCLTSLPSLPSFCTNLTCNCANPFLYNVCLYRSPEEKCKSTITTHTQPTHILAGRQQASQ